MIRRVFVAGHRGMVGSAVVRRLSEMAEIELVTITREELDLGVQKDVALFFSEEQIDEVYLCAARVGGIHANASLPAEFLYENLVLECNVIHQAWNSGVQKLLFLGSSCIYPRLAEQPIKETSLMGGPLEPTNEAYALAKIAGIKLCESYNRQYGTDFRSVMPTNLYGPGDNFHPQDSHVIPGLLRRFHDAKLNGTETITVWGTGKALREFLHVDDMAHACILVMNLNKQAYNVLTEPGFSHINVGTGVDCSIAELVDLIRDVTGFEGNVEYDASKPDGAPRKLLDVSKLSAVGWAPGYDLRQGLEQTYRWYVDHLHEARQ